jgi:hypothetical protein
VCFEVFEEILNVHSNKRQTRGSKMSEWNTVISVLGTLGGTALGLLLGYLTTSHLETKRQKHEREMEYRKELAQHMDDIFKPLFRFVEELWKSLVFLYEFVRIKSSIMEGKTLKDLLSETQNAEQNLKGFYDSNYSQMNLLFPHPISPWVFAPIEERLHKILVQISEGKRPADQEFTLVIYALMTYQKNLKRLLGYETMEKLEKIYPLNNLKYEILNRQSNRRQTRV